MSKRTKAPKLTGKSAQAMLRALPFEELWAAEKAERAELDRLREKRGEEFKRLIGKHGVKTYRELPAAARRVLDRLDAAWAALDSDRTVGDRIKALRDEANAILNRIPGWNRFNTLPWAAEDARKMIATLHLFERTRKLREELASAAKRPVAELRVGDIGLCRQHGFVRVVKITHGGKRVLAVPHDKPDAAPVKLSHTRWTSAVGTGRSELVPNEVQVVTESFIRRSAALQRDYDAA